VFVADFKADFDTVAGLLARDYSQRFAIRPGRARTCVPSLVRGVRWARYQAVYAVREEQTTRTTPGSRRFRSTSRSRAGREAVLQARVGDRWREEFSVDVINGVPAKRTSPAAQRSSRISCGWVSRPTVVAPFGLRKDFHPA